MPWVWRTDDGFIRMVEFLPYGARYYYYEPGEDYPFLISDPDYGYAFADGDLVAIYDRDGSLLPPEDLALRAPLAGRELARAQAMFRSSRRGEQPVALASWTTRRSQVASDLGRWRGLESHQPAWRTYHQQHLGSEQVHFAPERFRRAAETARIDRQIHDPDGADHAMRVARQAQDVARRAHVNIAMLPRHGQGAGPNGSPARMAALAAGPPGGQAVGQERRLAAAQGPAGGPRPEIEGLQNSRIERAPAGRMAAAETTRTQRLAMAQTRAEPRAQFNVRDRSAPPGPIASFAGPHQRAAVEARAAAPAPQARHDFAPAMASRQFQPRVEAAAPRTQPAAAAPHLQIVQAAPHGGGPHASAVPHPNAGGGGGHPNPGGGHPNGGGQPHSAPPHPGDDKHH